jgi:hypothetical protein
VTSLDSSSSSVQEDCLRLGNARHEARKQSDFEIAITLATHISAETHVIAVSEVEQ